MFMIRGMCTCFRAFTTRQQTKRFLARQDRTNGLFNPETKIYLAEMKPLQKPTHRTPRMVMRQKAMRFPFAWSAQGSRKTAQSSLENL
jgi:hypothetical protein